jgi:hypothetical protein
MAYGQWREALAGVGAIVSETVAEARAELESGAVAEEGARKRGGGRSGPRASKEEVLEQSASSPTAAHRGSSRRVSFGGHVTGLSTAARKRLRDRDTAS